MESGSVATHKKYQPYRQDILWNTDWGIPLDEMSKEDATRQGLLDYRGRWVTADERKILRDQYATYRAIRVISGFIMSVGIVPLILCLIVAIRSNDDWRPLAVAAVSLGVVFGGVGIGLWSFRRWARYLTVLFLVWGAIRATTEGAGPFYVTIIAVPCLYCLFRKTAREIFCTRVASRLKGIPVDVDDLAKDISEGLLPQDGILSKHVMSWETLRRHCDDLILAGRISESDYHRIVGEPFER